MSAEDRWIEAWRQRERLLRIARRRLPTREDAEDVVAEAIQRAGTQDGLPADSVPAWITRVTINLCIDRQRRLATQSALVQRAELRPDPLPSHEDDVANRAEARWVAGELDALPTRQAKALRLRAEGLDNPEVAARLGVTVATVEGLVKRSRAALRLALRAAGAAAVGAWAVSWRGRRAPALIAAVSVLMLALLPWSGDPPPARLPDPGRAPVSTTRIGTTPTEPTATPELIHSQKRPARDPAVVIPGRDVDPLIGTALPYEGPRCLAPYCLPFVDEQADLTLGTAAPRGWSPADLRHYLGEPAWHQPSADRRPLVVILSWYSFPWVADDLAVYRRTFRLPPCDASDGCLSVRTVPSVDSENPLSAAQQLSSTAATRTAGRSYNANPAAEQAQMLQGVSAACPECRLALVTAASTYVPDQVQALEVVRGLEADVVVTKLDVATAADGSTAVLEDPRLYDGPLVLAGGGVGGHTAGLGSAPRRFPNVVAVGGTAVTDGRVIADMDNESFCNTSLPQPIWQKASHTGCRGRAGMDLSMPAGPNAGLAVYISGGLRDGRGWYRPGHAAQAVALFGGLFARHNLRTAVRGPSDLYAHPEWFADLIDGSTACLPDGCTKEPGASAACLTAAPQLCTAGRGWDGPTGLGEPRYLPWL